MAETSVTGSSGGCQHQHIGVSKLIGPRFNEATIVFNTIQIMGLRRAVFWLIVSQSMFILSAIFLLALMLLQG